MVLQAAAAGLFRPVFTAVDARRSDMVISSRASMHLPRALVVHYKFRMPTPQMPDPITTGKWMTLFQELPCGQHPPRL